MMDQIIQNGWSSESAVTATDLLKKSDFALTIFQQGTGIPAANFNLSGDNDVSLKETTSFLEFKSLTNLLLVKAKQMESLGLPSEAAGLYLSALQFTYHLGQDSQTISKVTALTLEINICRAVDQAARKHVLTRRDRMFLRENLQIFKKSHFPAIDFVDLEQAFFLKTVSALAEEAKTNTAAKDFPSQLLLQKSALLSGQYNGYWRRALETNAPLDWERADAETKVLKGLAAVSFTNATELTGRFLVNALSGKTDESKGLILDQVLTYLYVIALPNYQKISALYQDSAQSLEATIQLLSQK
jgi:hypothetical protein